MLATKRLDAFEKKHFSYKGSTGRNETKDKFNQIKFSSNRSPWYVCMCAFGALHNQLRTGVRKVSISTQADVVVCVSVCARRPHCSFVQFSPFGGGRRAARAHSHRAAGACARVGARRRGGAGARRGALGPHRNCAQFGAMQWKRRRRVHYVIGSGKRALSLRQYRLLFRNDVTATGQLVLDDLDCCSPAAFLLELNSSGEGITRAIAHASTPPPLSRCPHPSAFDGD